MIKFDLETIPHDTQRYPTVGDYSTDIFNTTHFKISNLGDWRYEFLVGVHEVIEKYLCKAAGVKEEDIDAFDIAFEAKRLHGNYDEPGNDPSAPYFRQHQVATFIEKQLAQELKVDWNEYEEAINLL